MRKKGGLRLAGILSGVIHRIRGHTGQKQRQEIRALALFDPCGAGAEENLKQADRAFRKYMVWILLAMPVLLLAGWFTSGTSEPEANLRRGAYGTAPGTVDVEAELSAQGRVVKREMTLYVQSKDPEETEASALLASCGKWLQDEVFADREVHGDLMLPQSYADGLVSISWQSSDPLRISENGQVDLLDLPTPCAVILTAVMTAGSFSENETLVLFPVNGDASDPELSLLRLAEKLEQDLNDDSEGDLLRLPQRIGETEISWKIIGRHFPWELFFLGSMVLVFLYSSRYEKLKRQLRKKKASFERELPSVTLQLILLLNAGLVTDAAFEELLSRNREKDSPLYQSLNRLKQEVNEQNLSFSEEWLLFARKTGMRDLIRIASVISDNAEHGNELAGKLEREREQLWNSRISFAKAEAGKADTKLCFPLVLLLVSLVVLASAPAFMNM